MRRHVRFVPLLLLALGAGCGPAGAPDLSAAADAVVVPVPATVGTIALEGAKIPARDSFKVTVTDADANLDPSSLDGVVVHVSVARPPATSGPSTPALLVETGASTGVFTAAIPMPAGIQDKDVVTVEYRDPNAGSCTPKSVVASATVDAYSPDLYFVTDAFVIPPKIVVGETFRVAGVLANDARGGAAGASTICGRIFRKGWDSEGYEIVEAYGLDSVAVGALQPGGTFPFEATGIVPINSRTDPFTLELRADCGNGVAEFNEGNNLYQRTLGVDGPDLVVDPTLVLVPPVVISGQQLAVTATVRNVGGGASVATTARARIHRPGHDAEGYPIDESYTLETLQMPGLGAGASQVLPFRGVVPEGLNGVFSVEVLVDAGGVVAENNETNNATPAPQPTIAVNGADLTVELDPTTPASVVAGQPLVVTGVVRNATGLARAAASTVSVRYHRPGHDAEGYHIDESYVLGTAAIPLLEAGGSAPFTITGTAMESIAGAFTLEAMADSTLGVAEVNEQNNWATQTLTVIGADLSLEPVTVPAYADAGATYSIDVRISNALGGDTAKESTASATLYRRTCCDAEGYRYDEIYVLGPAPVPRLAPGDVQLVTLSGPIPSTASRAPFTLTVKADPLNTVQELNKANNTWTATVTVR